MIDDPNETMTDGDDGLDALVLARFRDGGAPSAIDRELRLPRGTSRGIVVGRWREDKERMSSVYRREGL